ncbi:MAG: glycosidase [Anaerolineaceae bacterium]
MILKRVVENPILKPNPTNSWESLNVFNCAVVYKNDLFHMAYRAQGNDHVSSIGYAVSREGIHFNRLQQPVLFPHDEWDTWGVEDPRITYLADEGRFIMAYTSYSQKGITPFFAESRNLITWRRIGPLVVGEENKDHVLFSRKINGRYVTFHRRVPNIGLAFSDDLLTWQNFQSLIAPRPGNWDCKRVGAGGPPIETEQGWLCIYHGYDDDNVYRLGSFLLDLEDPTRVIARSNGFLIEPEELWELEGDVPKVIFSTANPVVDGTVYVYYGGADRVIGLATCSLSELMDFTVQG